MTPEELQAKMEAHVEKHELTLPDGHAWSVNGFDEHGEVLGVTPVPLPGFPIPPPDGFAPVAVPSYLPGELPPLDRPYPAPSAPGDVSDMPLRVGDVLSEGAGGWFGRDTYGEVRVEAVGADWAVARDGQGRAHASVMRQGEKVDELTRYRL